MNEPIFTFIIIPIVVITVMSFARYMREKLAKPAYEDNQQKKTVQKPGKFDNFLLKLIRIIAILSGILMILGFATDETEMSIIFLFLTIVFTGVIFLLKREYNISYQENSDYFILKAKGKEYTVSYKNIVDWQPSFNEIKILDETREDEEFIRVNIAMLSPEILLRKIVDMTFAGKFTRQNSMDYDDPDRKQEIINYLVENNYSYLVEDYIERGY